MIASPRQVKVICGWVGERVETKTAALGRRFLNCTYPTQANTRFPSRHVDHNGAATNLRGRVSIVRCSGLIVLHHLVVAHLPDLYSE